MENNKERVEGYFKKIFPEYSCRLNAKGDKWLLTPNTEDYPLQHGKGESYAIPVVLIDAIPEPVPDTDYKIKEGTILFPSIQKISESLDEQIEKEGYWKTATGALMSQKDYVFLSTNEQNQCEFISKEIHKVVLDDKPFEKLYPTTPDVKALTESDIVRMASEEYGTSETHPHLSNQRIAFRIGMRTAIRMISKLNS